MSIFHLLMLIALIVQLPLAGLGFALEASRRKKRPWPRREPLALRPPQSAPPAQAERLSLPVTPPQTAPVEPERPAIVVTAQKAETASFSPPAPPVELPSDEEAAEQPRFDVRAVPRTERAAVESPAAPPIEALTKELPSAEIPQIVPQAPSPAPSRQPLRLGAGLRKTRENFLGRVRAAISGSARLDEIYAGLEEALIGADVGVETSTKIVQAVRARLKNDARAEVIRETLKQEITQILAGIETPMSSCSPLVILMSGVNGVGKTTTVAKLAAQLKAERGRIIVAASDTFRAAAIEQLEVWCDRVGVDLIKQKQGSDPAAVAFDAVKAANARKAAAVIIDTAGRLQTKVNLMEELKKIARVAGREIPGAPHENWLVLDATTGQNALSQAKIFGDAVKLTGVVLAKLDSTAKGGVIVAIADRLKLPVRYVGLGEQLDDLRPFDPQEFVEALFSDTETGVGAASGTYAA